MVPQKVLCGAFKAFTKCFEVLQRSVKIKIQLHFFSSSGIGTRRAKIIENVKKLIIFLCHTIISYRSSHQRCSIEKGVLKNFAKFMNKHLRQSDCNFIKKETLAQVFSCELWEISKNTIFTAHFWWLPLMNSCLCWIIDIEKQWKHLGFMMRCGIYLFKINEWKLFEINKNDIERSMTSFSCLCCKLWTDSTHCFGVSTVDIEQQNTG